MVPSNCSTDELLPASLEMSADHPQRIAYPDGERENNGIFGHLTNGQRISGYLPQALQDGINAQSIALMRHGSLSPALRELIIVRTGYHTASWYEVGQHRSLAEHYGVSTAKLDGLACIKPRHLEADEEAAIAFVDELLTRNRPGDAVLDEVRAHFTTAELLEILFVTGNWWTLARMLETAGVPLDERKIGDSA